MVRLEEAAKCKKRQKKHLWEKILQKLHAWRPRCNYILKVSTPEFKKDSSIPKIGSFITS
jgi:hypothetical protein